MPLYNWIQCTEKKDLTFVRKNKRGNNKKDGEAWIKIYDDYIKRYGLSKYYERLLKQYKRKALAELNFVINEDKFELTRIAMETQKLERIINNGGKGSSIEQALIHLSKWIGYWLKVKEITVKEFFDLSQEFDRSNKQIKENGE